jgi:V8-like Glu-specific endopeptidase
VKRSDQVQVRAGRRGKRHPVVRDEDGAPADDSRPRQRAGLFARASTKVACAAVLAAGVIVTLTPANGAAGDIASGFARAVRHLVAPPSQNGQDFSGTPAVGALFSTIGGKLNHHFCTASVVNSPNGDIVITAAHCVSSLSSSIIVFVPGYNDGATPYGVWTVSAVYVDKSWSASANPDDDVAFLRVSQPGSIVPIEDVTGAETFATGTSAHQLVQVIGYPDSANQAITCQNWTKQPMEDQLEFDCGGYTDGTSGGPFLAAVNPATGQGKVIGVIGGYEQGGYTPAVSYSIMFGPNVAALYRTAVAGG